MGIIDKAKRDAPTREERLRRLEEEALRREEESLRQEEAARLAALAQKQALQNLLSPKNIGKAIDNKGIYVGPWTPVDRDGQTLDKTFHVFAAPKDLHDPDPDGSGCRTFSEAAREVGALKSWNNHDGIYLPNDTALYAALKDGTAIGKWFIPTRDLLNGKDIDCSVVHDKHLYGLQKEGAFKGTFSTKDETLSPMFPSFYWSCAEPRDSSINVWVIRFLNGYLNGGSKNGLKYSCRPVRVELAPPPEPTP